MKLVKVLELARDKGQGKSSQRNPRTHNHQFGAEIIHHELEEVVRHGVPFRFGTVSGILVHELFELVAQGNRQRIHSTDLFDLELSYLAGEHVFGPGQLASNLAVGHEFYCQSFAYCTSNQVHDSVIIAVFVF